MFCVAEICNIKKKGKKNMKKIKLMMAMFMAIALFAGMGVVKAATDVTVGNAANNTFTITRTVNKVTNPVTNTFTYTIAPDASNPSGGATGVPASATVVFNNQAPDAQSKVATQTGTIDLSGVTFSKVGDYKFKVTETASTDAINYPIDSTDQYTIQVSVRFDTANPTQKVVTINARSGEGATSTKLSEANLPFTSESQLSFIDIAKTVTGNMGDVEEYFKVKVTITNCPTGDTYKITGQSYTGTGVQTVYNCAQGAENFVWMKHNETITIGKDGTDGQIPTGLTYNFVEQDATDYKTYINGSSTDQKASGNLTIAATNSNTIVNNFDRDTLTGVFLRILPYVVIIAIAVAGIVYMVVKNNKQKLAEEE